MIEENIFDLLVEDEEVRKPMNIEEVDSKLSHIDQQMNNFSKQIKNLNTKMKINDKRNEIVGESVNHGRSMSSSSGTSIEEAILNPESLNVKNYGLPPRDSIKFVTREKDIEELYKICIQEHQNIVISGTHGIGKTFLVLQCINEWLDSQYIQNAIFINAEIEEVIEDQIKEYAEEIGLEIKDKSTKDMIEDISAIDMENNILFVFDNISSDNLNELLPAPKENIYILGTTRISVVEQFTAYNLKVLEEEDGSNLIRSILNAADKLNDDDLKDLVTKINRLPLALSLAASNVKLSVGNAEFYPIKNYLTNYTLTMNEFEDINESILTSLRLNIEELNNDNSKTILFCSSYLNTCYIDIDIFRSICEDDTDDAINILENYHLVRKNDKDQIIINKAIQSFCREYTKKDKEKYLSLIFILLFISGYLKKYSPFLLPNMCLNCLQNGYKLVFSIDYINESLMEKLNLISADLSNISDWRVSHYAAYCKHWDVLKYISKDINTIRSFTMFHWSPFDAAALSEGAVKKLKHLVPQITRFLKSTTLTIAIVMGNIQNVEELIKSQCNINILDTKKKNIIYWAMKYKQIEIIELIIKLVHPNKTQHMLKTLLKNGGWKLASSDAKKMNVINWAIEKRHIDVIEYLINEYPSENTSFVLNRSNWSIKLEDSDGKNILQWALLRNNTIVVEFLLKYYPIDTTTILKDIDWIITSTDYDNKTVITWALHFGHLDVIELLIENFFDEGIINLLQKCGWCLTSRDNKNRTVVHWALLKKHIGEIERLIEAYCNKEIADILSETKWDPEMIDCNGRNVIIWAMIRKHTKTIEFLIEHYDDDKIASILKNNDLDATDIDKHGNTMIHWAVIRKNTEVIQFIIQHFHQQNISEILINSGWEAIVTDVEYKTVFDWAVDKKQTSVIEYLIHNFSDHNIIDPLKESGWKINTVDNHHKTVADWAIRRKNIDVILFLIHEFSHKNIHQVLKDCKWDINTCDVSGRNIIDWSIIKCYTDVIEYLLHNYCDDILINLLKVSNWYIDMTDSSGKTIVHWTVHREHFNVLKFLIDNYEQDKISNILKDIKWNVDSTDENNETLYNIAVKHRKTNVIEFLFNVFHYDDIKKLDFKYDFCDYLQKTVAHWAIEKKHIKVIELLFYKNSANGIDKLLKEIEWTINTTDNHGKTVIHWAINEKHTEVIEYLIEKYPDNDVQKILKTIDWKPDLKDTNDKSVLNWAVNKKHMSVIEFMLSEFPQFNYVKLLKDCGWFVNLTDKFGMTVADWAIKKEHSSVIEFLIKNYYNDKIMDLLNKIGFEVNMKDDNQQTVSHFAMKNHHIDVIECLIQEYPIKKLTTMLKFVGWNPNLSDNDGKTVAHWAAIKGHFKVIDILKNNYSEWNINKCDDENNNFGHYAALNGDDYLIQKLIDYGIDTNMCNNLGYTLLHNYSLSDKMYCLNLGEEIKLVASTPKVYLHKYKSSSGIILGHTFIALPTISTGDGVEYAVKKLLWNDDQKQMFDKLITILSNAPLAIDIAVSYILLTETTIEDILKTLEDPNLQISPENFDIYLNVTSVGIYRFIILVRDYLQTTYPEAFKILSILAYFSKDVYLIDLLEYVDMTYNELKLHIERLQQFSLLSINEDKVIIHQFIKSIQRIFLQDTTNNYSVISQILTVSLDKNFMDHTLHVLKFMDILDITNFYESEKPKLIPEYKDKLQTLECNSSNVDKWSVVHLISCDRRNGSYHILERLIELKQDVDISVDGITPLHISCLAFTPDQSVRTLINAGVNLNARTKEGFTPLHFATAAGRWVAMMMLVEAGADIHTTDNNGSH